MTSREKVDVVVKEAEDMKGEGVTVLDIKKLSAMADYFVLITGQSRRHVRNLATRIESAARKQKCKIHHIEGYSEAHWVLIDLNNVVVHVFDDATREYYELERLWGDAGVVTA
ncbi:MAG: ribosome silencing factor [bacterium]|nr:ribosome silencing factor [bacterium]